ncbi:MAG: hypothetical protein IT285_04790 [Bdellovibrionales bacterium]|nr:hypothetical protein [Bdellovibrionales bacterium]
MKRLLVALLLLLVCAPILAAQSAALAHAHSDELAPAVECSLCTPSLSSGAEPSTGPMGIEPAPPQIADHAPPGPRVSSARPYCRPPSRAPPAA